MLLICSKCALETHEKKSLLQFELKKHQREIIAYNRFRRFLIKPLEATSNGVVNNSYVVIIENTFLKSKKLQSQRLQRK